MKKLLLRFCFALFFITAAVTAKAGEEAVHPFQFDLKVLAKASIHLFNGNAATVNSLLQRIEPRRDRVCVCEILEVENNNIEYSNVAVLAEKENDGNIGKNYKIAEQQISVEKKQMKAIYFDKLKVNTKMAVATDCMSLYLKLSQKTSKLKLYDILNADIRAAIK
ncbi:MAG: hypothetical protein KIT80_11475 [Chitinophagaceae bacterium]|nr:hypothetical protein [Chitinophagaceae bacterium]MCW5927522.1 hypothetical protein [Chitinophagaceae bacterium]